MGYDRPWGTREQRLVAARQHWTCSNCKQSLDPMFELDHIVALHNGGTNDLENAQALCYPCHGRKTFHEERIRMDRLHEARERAIEAAKESNPDAEWILGVRADNVKRNRDRERRNKKKLQKKLDAEAKDPLLMTPHFLLKFAHQPQPRRPMLKQPSQKSPYFPVQPPSSIIEGVD